MSGPLIVAIDEAALSVPSANDTSIVINEEGLRCLVQCLGQLTPDELASKGLTTEQSRFLENLWAALGGA